jgi:hypothetical protein
MSYTQLEKDNFIRGVSNMITQMDSFPARSLKKVDYCLGIYETLIANFHILRSVGFERLLTTCINQAENHIETIGIILSEGITDKVVYDCLDILRSFLVMSRNHIDGVYDNQGQGQNNLQN